MLGNTLRLTDRPITGVTDGGLSHIVEAGVQALLVLAGEACTPDSILNEVIRCITKKQTTLNLPGRFIRPAFKRFFTGFALNFIFRSFITGLRRLARLHIIVFHGRTGIVTGH